MYNILLHIFGCYHVKIMQSICHMWHVTALLLSQVLNKNLISDTEVWHLFSGPLDAPFMVIFLKILKKIIFCSIFALFSKLLIFVVFVGFLVFWALPLIFGSSVIHGWADLAMRMPMLSLRGISKCPKLCDGHVREVWCIAESLSYVYIIWIYQSVFLCVSKLNNSSIPGTRGNKLFIKDKTRTYGSQLSTGPWYIVSAPFQPLLPRSPT